MRKFHNKARHLATVLGCAAVTAAAGITLGLPAPTHAGDHLAQQQQRPAPKVTTEGRVVRDAKSKTGWALEVKARNTTGVIQNCTVVAQLTETVSSPMSRVMPQPMVIFEEKHELEVLPNSEIVRRYPVPAKAALKLAKAMPKKTKAKANNANRVVQKKSKLGPPMMASRAFYRVRVSTV
ncbi:MAG: hypothetical protein JRI68_11835 [Deltaproteobacteria bacterium]|nr:hypothetical protein [Deltaproteobacteria bacterium]